MKKVLITGGVGFIGYHLANKLLLNDYRIDLLDNFSRGVMDAQITELQIGKQANVTKTTISGDIEAVGHITASGDISSSGGTIEAGFYKVDGLSALNGINGNLQIGHTDHTNLSLQPAGVTTNHITASGNISGSINTNLSYGGTTSHGVKSFIAGDTTPDVQNGTVFLTNNSLVGTTTITGFDNGTAGQIIHVILNDTNTDFTNGTNLKLFRELLLIDDVIISKKK